MFKYPWSLGLYDKLQRYSSFEISIFECLINFYILVYTIFFVSIKTKVLEITYKVHLTALNIICNCVRFLGPRIKLRKLSQNSGCRRDACTRTWSWNTLGLLNHFKCDRISYFLSRSVDVPEGIHTGKDTWQLDFLWACLSSEIWMWYYLLSTKYMTLNSKYGVLNGCQAKRMPKRPWFYIPELHHI